MTQRKLIVDDAFLAALVAMGVLGYFLQTPLSYIFHYVFSFLGFLLGWIDPVSNWLNGVSKELLREPVISIVFFAPISAFLLTIKLRNYVRF
tara:strand:- start:2273 stop:2548 length:276 start_codon:yes stop_codon:yes gene_type:complete